MKNAKVTYIQGLQFVGVASSGHAIVMDSDPGVGGNNTGPKPMELLLMGIGGCSGTDIISILRKKQQDFTGLEINVKGEAAEDYPKKFTNINLEFIVKGRNISEDAVKRSIDLSMNKYCSVKATLEGSSKISFSYKIIQE
ncbi:MAG: osmotically inducible protein OsmC [Nitrospirae bacterium RBG_13_39_12]|nr:MAG: osmotically inducible protein OsmC [Nitrospirae bacterium RBG_13_39_12]